MNILITGAFGFVGSNLSKTLKILPDHSLIAVDISEPENHTYNEYYSWNELEKVDWETVEVIIHLQVKSIFLKIDWRIIRNIILLFGVYYGIISSIFEEIVYFYSLNHLQSNRE